MRDILHQLSSLPGIAGALIYARSGEILVSEFPGIYEPSTLQQVVSLLSEDVIILQDMVGESGIMDLKFAGGRVIVKPCAGGSILVLCTALINSQLLNMALTQATRRLEKTIQEPPAAPPAAPPPAPQATKAPKASPAVAPASLEPVKQAFTVRVGPIGAMLFAQIYADWAVTVPATGLEGLVAQLAREIEDRADQQEFRKEALASLT
ncbi:MAG: hypothetical protein HY014_06035 [Acidobacteria bacterium]|nr:hypothetical protein [Acidobacteriota bacterium]MBI3487707.1 hypothetical protein [Acidobacteriota bacterium]